MTTASAVRREQRAAHRAAPPRGSSSSDTTSAAPPPTATKNYRPQRVPPPYHQSTHATKRPPPKQHPRFFASPTTPQRRDNPHEDNDDAHHTTVSSKSSAVSPLSVPCSPPHPQVTASRAMCAWCFDSLMSQYSGRKRASFIAHHTAFDSSAIPADPPVELIPLIDAKARAPVFVTWMKKRKADFDAPFERASLELRGCLGSLEEISIGDLAKYALKSALHDSRFSPITKKEIPHLQCKVSLLGNFEPADHIYNWSIEHHGVMMNFTDQGTTYNATFLPGIAKDHGMTHEVTIRELIRKSGWQGTIAPSLLRRVEVTRYESTLASLTFDEFSAWWKNSSSTAIHGSSTVSLDAKHARNRQC